MVRHVGVAWVVACVACGGGSDGAVDVVSGTESVEAEVGRGGAVLELREQARVTIPRDALTERTSIRVGTLDLDDLPARPGRAFAEFGRPLVVEPHDLRLGRTATLELAVRNDAIDDRDVRLLRLSDTEDETWERLDTRLLKEGEASRGGEDLESRRSDDDSLTGQRRVEVRVDTFSVFLVVRATSDVVEPEPGACDGVEAGTECRAARGPCDVAESCDGESPDCPADALADDRVECRAAADACDVAERCDGESPDCPADALAAAGSACEDDGQFCTGPETCDGEGNCVSGGDPCAEGVDETDDDCAESCDEEADDCTGENPDGQACFPSACAEGACQGGACVTEVECPVFVDARGVDGAGCGTAFGAAACASVQGGSDEAERSLNTRVFVRDEMFTAAGTAPVLTMAEGIAYYGGFAGSENLLSERPDPIDQHTVLNGNDTAGHVVVGAAGARLDGFVVTGGVGADEGSFYVGGGMYNQATDGLVIANGAFDGNALSTGGSSYVMGAGLFNDTVADLRLENVRVENNAIQHWGSALGGGMASLASSVTLSAVRFAGNTVGGSSSASMAGGGLYDENTSTSLDDVVFEANALEGDFAHANGAGYAAVGTSFATTLGDVEFVGNRVDADSAFYTTQTQGAGMHVTAGGEGESLELADVLFQGNTSNTPGQGGGLYVSNVAPTLTRVSFVDNRMNGAYGASGGGMYLEADGATVATLRDVQFVGNQLSAPASYARGGGMYVEASVDARHVDFIDNVATAGARGSGGGMHFSGAGGSEVLTLSSVSFVGNGAHGTGGASSSGVGGGLYADTSEGSAQLTHVTFLENTVSGFISEGSGLRMVGSCGIADCTLDHLAFGGNTSAPEIALAASAASLTLGAYCGTSDPGYGADFTAVGTYTDQFERAASGHAFLTPASVCRDAGDDAASDVALGAGTWQTLSSQMDGALDTGSADHGRLYTPSGPWIPTFEVIDATTLGWEVVAPSGTTCSVVSADFSYDVPAGDVASGSVSHSEGPSLFELRCSAGGVLARASLTTN